jgi:hypothetical protein
VPDMANEVNRVLDDSAGERDSVSRTVLRLREFRRGFSEGAEGLAEAAGDAAYLRGGAPLS